LNWIKSNHNKNLDLSNVIKKQKQFGWLITVCLIIFASVRFFDEAALSTSLIVSVTLLVLATLYYSKILKPILYVWMWVGSILSEISSFIILGLIYYLLFVPITILFRIKKKPPISGWQKKLETNQNYEALF
jgi:predicted membrane protein